MYKNLRPEEYTAISSSLEHVIEASFRAIRSVFLLNAGGCGLLIILMGSIIDGDCQQPTIRGIANGMGAMAIGVVFAALAQFCRYESRLSYFRSGRPLYPFRYDDEGGNEMYKYGISKVSRLSIDILGPLAF